MLNVLFQSSIDVISLLFTFDIKALNVILQAILKEYLYWKILFHSNAVFYQSFNSACHATCSSLSKKIVQKSFNPPFRILGDHTTEL